MKQAILGILVMMGLGLISKSAFADGVVPSISGDYCIDQAQEVLNQVYGSDIQINQVYIDSNGDTTSYWMKTNICAGHLVASFVKNAPCKSAHYGFVPSYIKRVWPHGASCKQVMPQEIVV